MEKFAEIFTKKDLIKFLNENIPDNHVILVCNRVMRLNYNKKDQQKIVEIHIPAKGFKPKDTVVDLLAAPNLLLSVVVPGIFEKQIADQLTKRLPQPKKKKK